MIADDSKLIFSSQWEIDQLTYWAVTVSFSFPVGNQILYKLTDAQKVGGIVLFDAQFKIGSGPWQEFGDQYFVFASSTALNVYNPTSSAVTMQVRYFIYSDKLDY